MPPNTTSPWRWVRHCRCCQEQLFNAASRRLCPGVWNGSSATRRGILPWPGWSRHTHTTSCSSTSRCPSCRHALETPPNDHLYTSHQTGHVLETLIRKYSYRRHWGRRLECARPSFEAPSHETNNDGYGVEVLWHFTFKSTLPAHYHIPIHTHIPREPTALMEPSNRGLEHGKRDQSPLKHEGINSLSKRPNTPKEQRRPKKEARKAARNETSAREARPPGRKSAPSPPPTSPLS